MVYLDRPRILAANFPMLDSVGVEVKWCYKYVCMYNTHIFPELRLVSDLFRTRPSLSEYLRVEVEHVSFTLMVVVEDHDTKMKRSDYYYSVKSLELTGCVKRTGPGMRYDGRNS